MPSDIDQWHINATVYKYRVEEVHYISNPARNIRRRAQTRVWHIESFLGKGGFGEVRLERNREEGTVRAVKRITTASPNLSNSDCERELKALLEFSKSREAGVFCDFYGWFRDGSEVYLAMEYVPLGDLEHNVLGLSGRLPETDGQVIVGQILEGLEIMHAEGFAHRDLKPQNILVVKGPPQWWVKICDLGLSKQLTDTTAFQTKAGTQSYMAPEMLNYLDDDNDSGEYTDAIDLWAVGCIIYRLITGKVPFPPGRLLMRYCSDDSLFPLDPLVDSGIKGDGVKFIRELLAPHAVDRPSASEALRHSWITADAHGGIPSLVSDQVADSTQDSELSMSAINFNSETHMGLKSYQSNTTTESESSNSHLLPAMKSLALEQPNRPIPFPDGMVAREPVSSHAPLGLLPSSKPVELNPGLSFSVSKIDAPQSFVAKGAADPDKEAEVINGTVLESSESLSDTTYAYPDPYPGPFLRPGFAFEPGNPVILPNKGMEWDMLWSAETRSPYWYNNRTKRSQKLNRNEMGIYLKSRDNLIVVPKSSSTNLGPDIGIQTIESDTAPTLHGDKTSAVPVRSKGWPTTDIPYADDPIRKPEATSRHQEELVRALYNHDYADVGDLVLGEGDVVKVIRELNPEWWRGTKVVIDIESGKQKLLDGIFPKSYVEPFSDEVAGRGIGIFDFYGAAAGDLPFRKGDKIILREAIKGDGWVRGSLGGKEGNVPTNYIQEMPEPTIYEIQRESINYVKCLFDNHPTSIEELILYKGNVIKLSGPVIDGRCRKLTSGSKYKDHLFGPKYNNWWLGSMPDGRVGVFSLSYVEVIPRDRLY